MLYDEDDKIEGIGLTVGCSIISKGSFRMFSDLLTNTCIDSMYPVS